MTKLLNKLPFAHHGWFMYLRLLVRHFLEDNCTQKAASLTYTTLLSLVPMIAVLLVIFSTVPALESVREQVQSAIYNNLLPASSTQVIHYIDSFAENSVRMTFVGVGVLIFTTIMTLITIETAFNQIWRVQDRTGGLESVIRYLIMVIGMPLILSVAFTASSAVQSIDFLNRKIGGYGIDWAVWAQILSFGVTIVGFVAMYWFIPKVKVPLKNAAIAGVIIAIIFECVKRFFGMAVTNFTSYEAVYGAFAALPIFLLWIHISWNLILLGVEISYTLTIFDKQDVPVRHPLLSLLDMLNLIYKRHKDGKSTSEQDLRTVLGRKELPKWHTYIEQLLGNHLIRQNDKGEYILKTDLNSMNLWQFYKTLPYPLPIKDELLQLKQADYDPWYVEIYDQLTIVESHAKNTLNTPLADLFDTAPLRPKEDINAISTQDSITQDNLGATAASFDSNANKAQDNGETILLPVGDSKNDGKVGTIARRIKLVRHVIGRSQAIIKDIKRHF